MGHTKYRNNYGSLKKNDFAETNSKSNIYKLMFAEIVKLVVFNSFDFLIKNFRNF